jgi:hypothetical protein
MSAMVRLLVTLAATVVLGLASRLYPVGWYLYDRILGEVLYAVAAYLVLAMIFFRQPPLFIAVLAFGCCLAVELFKLTVLIGFADRASRWGPESAPEGQRSG